MTSGAEESSCTVGSSLHGPSILERTLALLCEIKYAYLFLSDSTPPSLLTESQLLLEAVTRDQGQTVIDLGYY